MRDLTKDDFLLSEDGHPQTIRYFSRETDLPLTLGLLVDTSMSQRRVLDAERIASFRFVDQVLREATDHVFIVQFDMGVEIRQPLTSSRRALETALAQVDTPSMHQLELQRGGGTLLYEAIAVAARDVMRAANRPQSPDRDLRRGRYRQRDSALAPPSKRPSAPARWSTPSSSPTPTPTELCSGP